MMTMKGYSHLEEDCARARLEGVNVSYKDLAEVCGRLRGKSTEWALEFLEGAAACELPVFYSTHNKKLGHRRELGGRKGRYPWKAAEVVLKVLQSAMANGKVIGLAEPYEILVASANKKEIFPRMASKGRQARSCLETSRVEIVLKGQPVPKGVTVTAKKEEKKPEAKAEPKKEKPSEVVVGETKKEEAPKLLKKEAKTEHEHKHEAEKEQDLQKKRPGAKPHQHGEYDTR